MGVETRRATSLQHQCRSFDTHSTIGSGETCLVGLGILLGVGRELATKLLYKHVVHFVGFECEVNDVLTYGVFVLLGDVGEVNAVHQEYLAPLDTHFVGREVGAEHVVEHFLDIFLGKQVYRSHHEKVGAVAHEDAYFAKAAWSLI